MIKANTSFTFHNIGQGLFYSGTINFEQNGNKKRVNFIYDCGSKTKEKIKFELKRFKNRIVESNINMFIISHFHKDHINGIDYLLENFNVEKVFIPYITPMERLLIAIRDENIDSYYYEFLANPYKYLFDRGVREIVVIRGGKEGEDGNIPKEPLKTGENDNISFDIRIEKDKKKFKLDEELSDEEKNKVYTFQHKKYMHISGLWLFKFYVNEVSEDKIKEFKQCANNLLEKNDIKTIILKGSLRNKLKKCYLKVSKGLNNTSMMMMHIPINQNKINNLKFFFLPLFYYPLFYNLQLNKHSLIKLCEKYLFICEKCLNLNKIIAVLDSNIIIPCFDFYRNKDKFGNSLAGHIDLNYMYNNIINHFDFFKGKIIVNQIPHHGAYRHWNINFIDDFKSFFNIASAGKINSYGHPSKVVFEEIIKKGAIPIHVDEEHWFTIKGKVIW